MHKIACLIFCICCLVSIFADFLPGDAVKVNLQQALSPPSTQHLWGTDQLGRDLLKRSAFGLRTSLLIGASATLISFLIGILLGMLSGFLGGWYDTIIVALCETLLTLPFIVLIITLAAFVGGSLLSVIFILGFTGWPAFTKLIRSSVLSVRENLFIEAARATGAGSVWIIRKHIWPSVRQLAQTVGLLSVGQNILAEATLSFLGLGVPPTIPTLGGLLNAAQTYMLTAWWIVLFPGVMLSILVLSVNLLRERL